MRLDRVMIAAPKSGSGKTTVSCALMQALKDRGVKVAAYKCGPDYIDPMFHRQVIGVPSGNLDTFFTGEDMTKTLFLKGRTEGEFAVMEGVMGLYDGLGGIRDEGSSYDLARITGTPVVLVVDAKGAGRSVVPMIAGFLRYDRESLIRGVILNRVSGSLYETVKPFIESELGIRALGYLPDDGRFCIESRRLGLTLPGEVADIRERLRAAACEFKKTVSVDEIVRIAQEADPICVGESGTAEAPRSTLTHTGGLIRAGVPVRAARETHPVCGGESHPLIAVARDEAFCFYYEENLDLLRRYGARIRYFSPICDKKLPDGCCGLLIGGGYPELHAKELEENIKMRAEIRNALESGMPTVAECGGFMYLHAFIEDRDGNRYAMAGALPAVCRDTGKTVRFGYIELEEKQSAFLPEGERIKGHEFHYYDSEMNGDGCIAVKPVTGKRYPCAIAGKNRWLGFPHLYYPSNPAFAERFVKKAAEYGKNLRRENGR